MFVHLPSGVRILQADLIGYGPHISHLDGSQTGLTAFWMRGEAECRVVRDSIADMDAAIEAAQRPAVEPIQGADVQMEAFDFPTAFETVRNELNQLRLLVMDLRDEFAEHRRTE
jgi:hypothetical protein